MTMARGGPYEDSRQGSGLGPDWGAAATVELTVVAVKVGSGVLLGRSSGRNLWQAAVDQQGSSMVNSLSSRQQEASGQPQVIWISSKEPLLSSSSGLAGPLRATAATAGNGCNSVMTNGMAWVGAAGQQMEKVHGLSLHAALKERLSCQEAPQPERCGDVQGGGVL